MKGEYDENNEKTSYYVDNDGVTMYVSRYYDLYMTQFAGQAT